jgi:FKBP-type peptidyl-prolyl cis-trans isomerase
LRFVYGNEDQVLKGLEIALSQMHLHEKAEVILPSWLAFGSSGSADGRVSPFTTVVYQVEVLELAKN